MTTFSLLVIQERNTWVVRGHLKTTWILADMFRIIEYRLMAVKSHSFEVYFVHTIPFFPKYVI